MKTSEIGTTLIHSWEQFRKHAYQDSVGVWTIGWGSTYLNGKPVKKGMTITREQGDRQFAADLAKFEHYVEKFIEVRLNQNQFDALVSLCYNIGQGNLKKSRVIKHLNNGEQVEAANAFMRHVYARDRRTNEVKKLRGLVRRRKSERELFLTPESGHHLYELVDNLKPRGIDKLRFRWEGRKFEI